MSAESVDNAGSTFAHTGPRAEPRLRGRRTTDSVRFQHVVPALMSGRGERQRVTQSSPPLRSPVGGLDASTAPARTERGGLRIFAATLAAAGVVAVFVAIRLHHTPPALSVATAGRATHAVVFLIDGASESDVTAPGLPNLRALIRSGVTYNDAWIGQAEAVAASSAATIGTGEYPRATGVVGPVWTDAQTGQPSGTLSPGSILSGSLDALMQPRALPSLAGEVRARFSGATVLAVGGADCQVAAAATWRANYILCPARDGKRWSPAAVVGHSHPPGALLDVSWSAPVATGPTLGPSVEGWQAGQEDAWIGRYSVAAIRAIRPSLTFIEFPEVRMLKPYLSGTQGRRVLSRLMRGIDSAIGGVVRETRRDGFYGQSAFVVTSGETVSPLTYTVSRAALNNAVQAAGGQEVYLTADGSAFVGLQDPLQSQPVAQAIEAANIPSVDAIYYKSRQGAGWTYTNSYLSPELPASFPSGASFLLGTLASAASADVVALYAPHTGAENSGSQFAPAGCAGGLQWDTQRIPLIISGHGVYAGGSSDFPARLVDVAPTVAALMGLDQSRSEGVVLADAMVDPPGNAVDAQHSATSTLSGPVDALQRRLAAAGG